MLRLSILLFMLIPTACAYNQVNISNHWKMPKELDEISGISQIDDNRFACVEDEDGLIYIFNTKTSAVEKTIRFANSGDYEGITLAGTTAWVVRSNGTLYEVKNFMGELQVNEYRTFLSGKDDVEGVSYDQKNDRLLLSVKEENRMKKDKKGIYAFDLKTKKLQEKPAFVLDIHEKIFEKDDFKPSDLAIEPKSGDIYILDGPRSRLLVLSDKNKYRQLYSLEGDEFPQPEGICFGRNGKLYISNETGKGEKANILEVKLRH